LPTPSVLPTVTAASDRFSPEHLKERVGLGVSYMSYIGPALSLRYWAHDDEAYDFSMGGYDNPSPGKDFANDLVFTPNWGYGVSVGLRHNWRHPAEDVFVQWIARLSYSQTFYQNSNSSVISTSQNQDLSLFIGPGFEAFVPFWKNISIEGNIGLSLDSHWSQYAQVNSPSYPYTNPTPNYWSLSLGINNTITSILNAAVHFYL